MAATHGGGLFATEPREDLTATYAEAGGTGPRYVEIPVAWGTDVDAAVEHAHKVAAWSLTGWKVMSELPNPVNFEAAAATVRPEDVREKFVCGNDPQAYFEIVKKHVDAGFDHIVLMNNGPDQDGFFDFAAKELVGHLG
jgi:G6PDH family F420-dependent oxidoreductase